MSRKKHKPEEIVAKLRQVDVLVSREASAQRGHIHARDLAAQRFDLMGERPHLHAD